MDISKANNTPKNSTLITKASLLYVDVLDDKFNKNSEVFKQLFKNVYLSNNKKDTLALYDKHDTSISIIIINIDCKSIHGIECIKYIRKKDNDIPILITSSFEDSSILLQVLKFNIHNYIAKPILMNTTIRIMVELLNEIENEKLIRKQQLELTQFKEILDKQNLVSETDTKGIITYANDIFCDISGYSKDELLGQPHSIVRHPDSPSNVFKNMWETIKRGEVWQGKVKNIAKDGSAYYTKALIVPIFDTNGEIIKYTSSRFLITEDEKHKQMLKKQILTAKTADFSKYKQTKAELQIALDQQEVAHKDDILKLEETIKDINSERKELKRKVRSKESRIFKLEDEIKLLSDKHEMIHTAQRDEFQAQYQKNQDINKNFDKLKQNNYKLEQELETSQETIRKMQEYIDGYLKRIDDLEDVIKSNGL